MIRKTCAHCRKKLIPDRPSQKVHEECAADYILAQKAKQERLEARRKRESEKADRQVVREKLQAFKTIPQLIAKAQEAFNAYIRERDKDKGCFVCGRPFEPVQGRRQHAGHVRSRGAAGHLRFHEDNCMGECEGCNGPHGAKPHQIKAGAIARIGLERFDALEADNTHHKWTKDELIAIRERYKQKLKDLKNASADQIPQAQSLEQ